MSIFQFFFVQLIFGFSGFCINCYTDLHFEILLAEKLNLYEVSVPFHPSPVVRLAILQYVTLWHSTFAVCVCSTHIAHVLIPVNLVYILMTDKIAHWRHTCSCLREEIKNLAWMTEFLHGHSTWYLAKLLKNFTDSILTRDLRNFPSGPSAFLPQTLLWSSIKDRKDPMPRFLLSHCVPLIHFGDTDVYFYHRNLTNFKANPWPRAQHSVNLSWEAFYTLPWVKHHIVKSKSYLSVRYFL